MKTIAEPLYKIHWKYTAPMYLVSSKTCLTDVEELARKLDNRCDDIAEVEYIDRVIIPITFQID